MMLIDGADPRLRQRTSEVEGFGSGVRMLFSLLEAEMRHRNGIGIAAPQIGDMRRCCIVLAADGQPVHMANPRIVWASHQTMTMDEGCLSFGEERWAIERHARVRVRYLAPNGIRVRLFDGIEAACAQHEIDHLDGITFRERGR